MKKGNFSFGNDILLNTFEKKGNFNSIKTYTMTKKYLTPELIQHIQQKAKDIIWKIGVQSAFKKEWYSILSVSLLDLIHFHGNEDTGWEHAMKRHGYYSNEPYFGKGALGEPSKFKSTGTPIFDWVQIADDVFSMGELDTRDHPDSDLFVKYTGKSNRFEGSNGEMKDFSLILYRDTKIVHSIFPKKDMEERVIKSKLKDIKRAPDLVTAEWHIARSRLIIRIPYINRYKIVRYTIIIATELETIFCKAHLQINWPSGNTRYSMYTLMTFNIRLKREDIQTNNIEFTRFLNTFTEYGDFRHIEGFIERTEKILFSTDT